MPRKNFRPASSSSLQQQQQQQQHLRKVSVKLICVTLSLVGITFFNVSLLLFRETEHRQKQQHQRGIAPSLSIDENSHKTLSMMKSPTNRFYRNIEPVETDTSTTRSRILSEEASMKSKPNFKRERPTTFVGIFVDDSFNGATYRKRQRELFQIWNDTRVCQLADFEQRYPSKPLETLLECELVWTFIVGAGTGKGKDKHNPGKDNKDQFITEIVDDRIPLLIKTRPVKAYRDDINDRDVTLLNIK